MQHLLRRKGRWLGVLAALATMIGFLAPPAFADNYGNSTTQHTSLWTWYDGTGCVAISEDTTHTSYPTDTWYTAVSSALTQASSLSFSASIKGYLGLTYTPSTFCNDAWTLNTGDLIVTGQLFKWNGSAWGVCETNPGWPAWTPNNVPTWGWKIEGNAVCGAGWYYSAGSGRAYQNNTWREIEPSLTNAGPSGPIWMG